VLATVLWVTVQFFVTGSSIILQVFSGIVLDFGSVSLADASPLTQLQARSPCCTRRHGSDGARAQRVALMEPSSPWLHVVGSFLFALSFNCTVRHTIFHLIFPVQGFVSLCFD
jgi:hypothetical protein